MIMNLMDSLTNGLSMMVGAAGLEILETIVVCVAMVKVIQITYKVLREGYEEKDGKTIIGIGFGVGVVKAFPHMIELIRIGFGV